MSESYATLVDLLTQRAEQQTRATAYTFLDDGEYEGARLTYAELDRRARAIAATLQDRGLAPGDRALLLFAPGLDFIPAFFGCLYAGVVAVPCYPPQAGQLSRILPRLRGIVHDAAASVVLSTRAVASAAERVTAQTGLRPSLWLATDAMDDDASMSWRRPALIGDTLAFLQYTSGSTAAPRGVMVTHANLLHNLAYARCAGGNDATTVSVSWLPVIHDMGLIEGVLQPLYAGYPAYLMAPASFLHRPVRWLQAITRYRATNSGAPNFAYDLCVRRISDAQRAELDLREWRIAYNGSEPIRAETLTAFHERFGMAGFRWNAFRPAYGLAEATLLVSTVTRGHSVVMRSTDADALARGELASGTATDSAARSLVSSGAALYGTTVVVVDPVSHRLCADGRVGEIWVRSPSVARGYWRREDETRHTFDARLASGDGPYLRTGDLGVVRDGEIFITGRSKDLLIVRGMKHYPQDIEQTAEQHDPAIRAGCSAAFSLGGDDDAVALMIEVDPRRLPIDASARDAKLGRLVAGVRAAIAEHHGIVLVTIVLLPLGAIPKTSSGKIQRGACRAALDDRSLNELTRWPLPDAPEARAGKLLRTGS